MRRILAMLLVICMALSLCACGKGGAIEGKGYKTPEEALLAYAEALKTGDVDKILATFAVETHVKNFDMKAYLERTGAYSPAGEYILNPIDAYSQDAALIQRQYMVIRQVSYMCGYAALGEAWGNVIAITESGEYKSASKFLKKLDQDWMGIFAEIEIGDIVEPEDLLDEELWEKVEDNTLRQREKQLGCDDFVALALEIELDGEDYYLCMEIACYDGTWYNCIQGGNLAAILGAPGTSGGLILQEEID